MKAIVVAILALSLSACVIEADEGSEPEESYENHVKLECNGSVLLDRTFTSREACEDHRLSNTYSCGSIKLTFSC